MQVIIGRFMQVDAHAEQFKEFVQGEKSRDKELELADRKIDELRAELDQLRKYKVEADQKIKELEAAKVIKERGLKLTADARNRMAKHLTEAARVTRMDTMAKFLKSDEFYYLKKNGDDRYSD